VYRAVYFTVFGIDFSLELWSKLSGVFYNHRLFEFDYTCGFSSELFGAAHRRRLSGVFYNHRLFEFDYTCGFSRELFGTAHKRRVFEFEYVAKFRSICAEFIEHIPAN
jgi:hypothetical protein